MTSLPAAAAFQVQKPEAARLPNPWAGDGTACPETGQRLQRSSGVVELAFRADGEVTRLERAYQSGCGRVRLPRQHDVPFPTGVVINTAGGLTGGDRFAVRVALGAGCRAAVTTQAAEKVYRSAGGVAEVENQILLGAGAHLDWLPQEAILFDGGALSRRTQVTMAEDATLTATELVVFGRTAMGETVESGLLGDRWRIVRDGRLVFADATRLAGPIRSLLERPATAAGAPALALVVHVGASAPAKVGGIRQVFADARQVEAGVSAYDGLLVARMIARSGGALRAAVLRVIDVVRDGLPPPRPWLI
jgi:urease accessory protein